MKIWLDAQLSPGLARWMSSGLGAEATSVRDLGLRDARDSEIFMTAHAAGAVVMTKDADFVALLERHGPPPQVVLVTCGNTSNAKMREILTATWPNAHALLAAGEPLVELADR